MYFVKVKTGKGVAVKKFIKNKLVGFRSKITITIKQLNNSAIKQYKMKKYYYLLHS